MENYDRLVAEVGTDQGFGLALSNTVYFSLLSVPLSVAMGVGLAVLLSANVKGQAVFRTLVFLPSVIPIVATSVLWLWLLDPDSGMINYCLSWIGLGWPRTGSIRREVRFVPRALAVDEQMV